MLDVRWEDIELERKTWKFPVTKSDKPRTVPLYDKALEILQDLFRVNEYVFPIKSVTISSNSICSIDSLISDFSAR
ncbi:tyrosine-type recombinase/integrase [Desulfonatronovibrio magnus]|uniref:tyrosine-type recombinase/integrase n=1 Tax=Desulfonatronovibrio magnus TaxID=698827 RepID=UPI0005EB8620